MAFQMMKGRSTQNSLKIFIYIYLYIYKQTSTKKNSLQQTEEPNEQDYKRDFQHWKFNINATEKMRTEIKINLN